MNHYPRHVGDYIRDTVDLTMLEDGAYTRLLDQYYSRAEPLPSDREKLYRIARASSKPERAAVDSILRQFFVQTPDGWRNKRADLELDAQDARSKSASESAKRRWEQKHAKADANAMRTHSEGISDGNADSMLASSQEPVTSNQRSKTKAARKRAVVEIPDWIPNEPWQRWVQHRGAKLTPHAIALQVSKLDDLRSAFDLTAIINRSIENSWATFYPLSNHTQGKPGARQATANQIFEGIDHEPAERDITAESTRVA